MSEQRARLIALLDRHVPEPGKEADDLERMRAYARALEQPFSRNQPEAHFTASVILADRAALLTCLVHHRKLLKWLQPGGHFEPEDGGDLIRAATREVLEETGCTAQPCAGPIPLDVDIHTIPARAQQGEHLHLDLRIVMTADDPSALRHDSAESIDARWFTWEDADRMADADPLRRALRKARALLHP